MTEKRPAETSTEEPDSKKQSVTPQMYEERIAELEKRNTDAQEMTQKLIEEFQERTAVSEEKFEKIKTLLSKLNKDRKELKMWNSYYEMAEFNLMTLLKTEFKNKITIVEKSFKSVEDEINQLMK
tara:strand:- start:873 stop:1247 length:375 start_codon:yes stop_codon:yes gene_type:complete